MRWALPLPLVIAWRYVGRRRSRLLDRTALAALVSLALGVASMVVAMALMRGYRGDLEAKLSGGDAAVLVYVLRSGDDVEQRLEALTADAEVTRAAPVIYGQGTITGATGSEGELVTLRGVEPSEGPMGATAEALEAVSGRAGATLGEELARVLEVGVGDAVRVMAVGFDGGRARFGYRTFQVGAIFSTGFAEFDRHWVVVGREEAMALVGGGGPTLYEVAVTDPTHSASIARRLDEELGEGFLVTSWQEMNRELFTALKLQQVALFFVLGLIVLVSTFNVASTLVVLVRERLREIGLLGALGLRRRSIAAIFLCYAATVGLLGIGAGVGFGGGLSWVLSTFELVRFAPEVAEIYFLRSVPFEVVPFDLAAVVAFSVVVTVAASALPAWRASGVVPGEALRSE